MSRLLGTFNGSTPCQKNPTILKKNEFCMGTTHFLKFFFKKILMISRIGEFSVKSELIFKKMSLISVNIFNIKNKFIFLKDLNGVCFLI